MTRRDTERFLKAVARSLDAPASILLIGGAARIVLAGARATADIDLELEPTTSRRSPERLRSLMRAVENAQRETGIVAQAAENIERWSMISWADYKKHLVLWRQFGPLSVYVLEPEYFAMTKLIRSSSVDLDDIYHVLRVHHASWRTLARVCGNALRTSPLSTQQGLFRRQVEHFFTKEGTRLWGTRFQPQAAVATFHRAARITSR